MKAKEYFNREIENIKKALADKDENRMGEIGKKLYIDFINESQEICEKRHVKFDRGFHPIIREQNQKWNVLAAMIEKELGFSVFRRDAFKTTLMSHIEEAKKNKEEPK